MKGWMKCACVLLVGTVAALAQDIHDAGMTEVDVVPGKLEVLLKESSLAQFDRESVLQGSLITGLASLDALNQQQGLLAIDAPPIDPRDTLIGPRLIYLFDFPPETDMEQLVDLYSQNEHLDHVSPVIVYRTSVSLRSWGGLKAAQYSPVP